MSSRSHARQPRPLPAAFALRDLLVFGFRHLRLIALSFLIPVAAGVALHKGKSPLEILQCLGGRELAAMAGATLAARLKRVPVLLDGYVCTAAVAPLEAEVKGALDHCVVAHASAEPGHRRLLDAINKQPLLDMGMRLGEASGAALAVGIVKAAVACHAGMATFAEAGVAGKE